MTYKEFCYMITPSVLELQNRCAEMTKGEFEDYRAKVMQEVGRQELSEKFMAAIFDRIYTKCFSEVA